MTLVWLMGVCIAICIIAFFSLIKNLSSGPCDHYWELKEYPPSRMTTKTCAKCGESWQKYEFENEWKLIK